MELFGGVISIKGITFFMFCLFAILAVGYLIGRITVKGISLGDSGVFIIALVFGCLLYGQLDSQMTVDYKYDYPKDTEGFVQHYEELTGTKLSDEQIEKLTYVKDDNGTVTNEKAVHDEQVRLLKEQNVVLNSKVSYTSNALKLVENFGLILFVTSVGFIAGPKFFGNFKKNFKSYVLLGLVVIISGGLAAIGCICFGRYVMGAENYDELTAMIVGLLSGSLTSTPAFSAAKATVDPIYENAVTVGHGIAYIFGVLGVVLFVQLIPKLMKANMADERAKLVSVDTGAKNKESKSPKKLIHIDHMGMAAFSVAAVLGAFIGMVKIPLSGQGLSGTCFSLTTTGGCLLVSLIFGHFGRFGRVNVMPSESTLKLFRELGLVLFLAGAGVAGGAKFIEMFKVSYFLYGIIMTIIPMIFGFLFAKYVLKLSLLNNLGSITGGMTSTPALGTLINVSGTEDVAAAYAATYPVALIAVVLVSQFLIVLF